MLALVAVVFVLQVCALTRKAPNVDVAVMAAAANILDNGVLAEPFVPSSVTGPGRSMTPGYPAILAAVALLDARMAEGIRCLAMEKAGCFSGNPFRLLLVLQTLVGLIALALACFLAHELSGSAEIAGLTTLLMFVMGRFAHVAGLLAPNVIVMALVLAFCTLLVLAHRHRSVLACALSGLTLGVLALIEIYYAALTVLVPLLLVAADRWHVRPDRGFAWRAAAAFAVAAGLAFAPWVARNVLLFGDMALTQAVTSKLLAERVAYNNSTAGELLAAGLYWIPGSNFLLSAETKSQFDLYYEETLLLEGARIQAKAQAAGGVGGPTVRLLQVYVLGDPVGYAGASLPLLLRGIGSTGGLLVLWGWLAAAALAAATQGPARPEAVSAGRRSAHRYCDRAGPSDPQSALDEPGSGVRLRLRHRRGDRRSRASHRPPPTDGAAGWRRSRLERALSGSHLARGMARRGATCDLAECRRSHHNPKRCRASRHASSPGSHARQTSGLTL